jgi:hypothetical protein
MIVIMIAGLICLMTGFVGVSWAFHSVETLMNNSLENAALGLLSIILGCAGIVALGVWAVLSIIL